MTAPDTPAAPQTGTARAGFVARPGTRDRNEAVQMRTVAERAGIAVGTL